MLEIIDTIIRVLMLPMFIIVLRLLYEVLLDVIAKKGQ